LFLELVVPNSVVARNDDPAVDAGFAQPDNILSPLSKEFVMDADLDTGGGGAPRALSFGPAIYR
jgi:hypothetical protein